MSGKRILAILGKGWTFPGIGHCLLFDLLWLALELSWRLWVCRLSLWCVTVSVYWRLRFLGDSVVKNLPDNAGVVGSIRGSWRSLGEGNGSPLQYFCRGNPRGQRNLGYGPCVCLVVFYFATPWTVACQTPLSVEFSRQKYWSRLPFPTPGDLPDSGIKPSSLVSPALASRFFTAAPLGLVACMHAKSLQSCPTLCDPVYSRPPGSSVHRIL